MFRDVTPRKYGLARTSQIQKVLGLSSESGKGGDLQKGGKPLFARLCMFPNVLSKADGSI